jgi:hypothetical protein
LIDWKSFDYPVAVSLFDGSLQLSGEVTLIHCESGKCMNCEIDKLIIVCVHVSVNRKSAESVGDVRYCPYIHRSPIEIRNDVVWRDIVCNFVVISEEFETFSMFRVMLADEDLPQAHKFIFSETFPDDCLQNLLFYLDINDWYSFSHCNKDCLQFTETTIWKQLYYQTTGTQDKPENMSYYQMCSSFHKKGESLFIEDNSYFISIDILDLPNIEKNEIFNTLLQDIVSTERNLPNEEDDGGMGDLFD